MTKKKKSDFGRGFVYNLVLFAIHFSNESIVEVFAFDDFVRRKIDTKEAIGLYGALGDRFAWWVENIVPIWGSYKKALSRRIESWASGASDHLYELEIPRKWKGTKIGRLAKQLKGKGLRMGHGHEDVLWTINDVIELQELTKKIARLIDKELGVAVIKARWE